MIHTRAIANNIEISVDTTTGIKKIGFLKTEAETLVLYPNESGTLYHDVVDPDGSEKDPWVGIDMSVLNSLTLEFYYIRFIIGARSYGSTRAYVKAHGTEKILVGQGRSLAAMPLRMWDMMKAILWHSATSTKQLSLFENQSNERKNKDSILESIYTKSVEKKMEE